MRARRRGPCAAVACTFARGCHPSPMTRGSLLFSCMALLALSACGGGTNADAGSPADAPDLVDAPAVDAPDLVDAPAVDAGPGTDAGCTYLDEPIIVSCGGAFRYVRAWSAPEGDAACPRYATGTDGTRYATLSEAIAGSACDGMCVWRAATSVTLLRCGRRTGYIEFAADGCDPVFETPDGIFRTIAEWDAAAPCM